LKDKKLRANGANKSGHPKALGQRPNQFDDIDSAASTHPQPPSASSAQVGLNSLLKAVAQAKAGGNLQQAKSLYINALEIQTDSYELWNDLGNIQRRVGEIEQAISSYKMALCINPHSSELHFNLGIALEDSQEQSSALFHYREALRLQPKLLQAWRRMGLLQLKLGQSENALISFKTLIDQRPNDGLGHCLSGLACYQSKNYKQAAHHHRRAIRIAPSLPQAHGWLGDALMKLGRPTDALSSYNRAIELGSSDSEVILQKAIALEELGQSQQAIAIYERLLLQESWPPSTPSLLAIALLKTGHNAQAFAVMRCYQCNHPSLAEPLHPTGELGTRWNGIPLTNPDQTLIILGDRDAGHSLHALARLKVINAGAAKVIICLPDELVELARKTDIGHEIITVKDLVVRPHQVWIPILDALALSEQQRSGSTPQLIKRQQKQRAWYKSLRQHKNNLVAICAKTHDAKAPQTSDLFELICDKKANVIALNPSENENILDSLNQSFQLAKIQTQLAKLHRLSDLAIVLKHCNLFITSNPLMAHLAGWMNVHCLLVLAENNHDWRWQHDGQGHSRWYPKTLITHWTPQDSKSFAQTASLLEPQLKGLRNEPIDDNQPLGKAA